MTENPSNASGPARAAALREGEALRIDRRLLEILVCPLTKSALRYDEAAQELISSRSCLAYPIRDGIPILLPYEAREIERP